MVATTMENQRAKMLVTPATPKPKPHRIRARTCAPRTFHAQIREDRRPQEPQKHNVEKKRYPLRVCDVDIVERQKLNLQQKQQQNWKDDERRQGDEFEHRAENAGAEFRRAGKNLDKDIARQQPPQLVANFLMRAVRRCRTLLGFCLLIWKLASELIVETRGFFAEHNKMHQGIGVDDEDHKGCQSKKGF
jgi:hypothetical protein